MTSDPQPPSSAPRLRALEAISGTKIAGHGPSGLAEVLQCLDPRQRLAHVSHGGDPVCEERLLIDVAGVPARLDVDVHVEESRNRVAAHAIQDDRLLGNRTPSLGSDPLDAPAADEERGLRVESSPREVQQAHAPHQQWSRFGYLESEPDGYLLARFAGQRLSPDSIAVGIDDRAVGSQRESGAAFVAHTPDIGLRWNPGVQPYSPDLAVPPVDQLRPIRSDESFSVLFERLRQRLGFRSLPERETIEHGRARRVVGEVERRAVGREMWTGQPVSRRGAGEDRLAALLGVELEDSVAVLSLAADDETFAVRAPARAPVGRPRPDRPNRAAGQVQDPNPSCPVLAVNEGDPGAIGRELSVRPSGDSRGSRMLVGLTMPPGFASARVGGSTGRWTSIRGRARSAICFLVPLGRPILRRCPASATYTVSPLAGTAGLASSGKQ
jgi:hypothetical protein